MLTTRLYLDTRRSADSESRAPLKLSIYCRHSESYIFTGVKLTPAQWDAKRRCAKDKAQQLTISRFKLKVDTLLDKWQEDHKLDGLTASEIKRKLERELSPDTTQKTRFLGCMERYASTRKKKRTTEIYQATIDKIRAFDKSADLLMFEDLTYDWLVRFDAFLSTAAKKKNARNIHFRNIRAVFKDAMKKHQIVCYPFAAFDMRPEATMKRDLSVEQIRTLIMADVPTWQRRYIDFFMISFMLIGMNTEDILHATDITGDRLEYRRAKTYRPYSIRVEKECRELIEKYPGNDYLLDVLDHYSSTHNWTSRIDNALKDIASPLGLPMFSMYWARHSWATIAAELDIPKETIAAALGHSSNTVTDIYINFDRAKIDRANRRVLDYVLYNKKPQDMYDLLRQINENTLQMAKKAN